MKYLKLYENFNNNIEDIIEDIKWIMVEMVETHKFLGHEKDDCFLYEISNMPTKEDLDSAKGRLEDLEFEYNIVYIGEPKIGSRDIHDKTICWIVKSELCKEYSPLPIIINGKFAELEGNTIIEDIQKNILLKMWKEESVLDKTRLQMLCVFNHLQMKKVGEWFREYLGPKAIQIVDSILKKNKEHHILLDGYDFFITIEEYTIESDIRYSKHMYLVIKCKILPGGKVSIMDDGRTLDLEDAVNDEEIGLEIKGEISDCIVNYFYNKLHITKKTGYDIGDVYYSF
jgi:hypothetical protein